MAPSAIKGSHVNIQPRLVSVAHASRLTCLGKASCLTTQAHATGRTMACVVALVTFDDLTLSLYAGFPTGGRWSCIGSGPAFGEVPPPTHIGWHMAVQFGHVL